MHLPEGGAPSQVVVDQCVLQQVITHVDSVVQARRPATLLEHPVLVGRGLRDNLQHVPVLDHIAVLVEPSPRSSANWQREQATHTHPFRWRVGWVAGPADIDWPWIETR
jgi:hypothetical protein